MAGVCVQVLTRVMLELPESFVKDGMMDRLIGLMDVWVSGFMGLPIRFPGTSARLLSAMKPLQAALSIPVVRCILSVHDSSAPRVGSCASQGP